MASRRDFLHSFGKALGRSKEESSLWVRPPYGSNESFFQSECPECIEKPCVTACDEKIIVVTPEGVPALNFAQNGCTFCEACALVCESNALSLEHSAYSNKINALFRISTEACIAHHGVICASCKEPCIDDAILFNGLFNPVIDEERCTGCGFCLSRCPTQAISYQPYEYE